MTMTISRDEYSDLGGGTPLSLNDETKGYLVVRGGFDIGSRSYRRQTVQSPFTEGRTVVANLMDVVEREITIRVFGSTAAQRDQRMYDLIRAFTQFSFVITTNIQGTVRAWRCETADVVVGDGGKLQEFHAMRFMQDVTFMVPCHPRQLTTGAATVPTRNGVPVKGGQGAI